MLRFARNGHLLLGVAVGICRDVSLLRPLCADCISGRNKLTSGRNTEKLLHDYLAATIYAVLRIPNPERE